MTTELSNQVEVAPAGPRSRQMAVYSLGVGAAAALMVAATWWLVRPAAPDVAVQRRVTDVALRWKCPNGHFFERRGSYHPVDCPECGRQSAMIRTYVCRDDGAHPALIRLTVTPEGRETVAEVSFDERVWNAVSGTVPCPVCGSAMTPLRERPFQPSSSQ